MSNKWSTISIVYLLIAKVLVQRTVLSNLVTELVSAAKALVGPAIFAKNVKPSA